MTFFFVLFSAGAVGSAIAAISRRNAVYSALWVLGTFASLSGLFVLLDAPLIAVFNLLLYAGAVIVLFLFVIMLLDLRSRDLAIRRSALSAPAGILAAAALFALLAAAVLRSPTLARPFPAAPAGAAQGPGALKELGAALFGRHLLPFEIASLLLLVAIFGAVFLGKRGLGENEENPKHEARNK